MNKIDLQNDLKSNNYPGRGIIIGKTPDSENAVIAYFIMGRSTNSRNRIFERISTGSSSDGSIRTKAFDESKLSDPSLIIYSPVKDFENKIITTNGDQTDTIFDFLKNGKTFEEALRTRTFEPDEPNFTPRISSVIMLNNNAFEYKMAILKSNFGREDSAQRFFFEYCEPINGEGHLIHTYKCDGDPIPSFLGEPKNVIINENDLKSFTDNIWNSLNQDNKVSLYTRFINLKTGKSEIKIVNKLK